jgi:tRNA-binding EMAP/Myf-like protein
MKHLPVKPQATLQDLDKLDIRVGTIQSVADVEGSPKLVEMRVDFGDFTRTVLAGLKSERDDPTEVQGLQALFVVNLPTRTMAGRESEAMLFDIGYPNGIRPVLAVPEEPVPDGAAAG